MASSLLGAAVQLSVMFADPASAALPPAQGRLCTNYSSTCTADPQLPQIEVADVESGQTSNQSANINQLRQGLLASSLRLAALNSDAARNLQAFYKNYTIRYAIAMTNYFRVRHVQAHCTVQVAAWYTALNAAERAKINSGLRDIPPECPQR